MKFPVNKEQIELNTSYQKSISDARIRGKVWWQKRKKSRKKTEYKIRRVAQRRRGGTTAAPRCTAIVQNKQSHASLLDLASLCLSVCLYVCLSVSLSLSFFLWFDGRRGALLDASLSWRVRRRLALSRHTTTVDDGVVYSWHRRTRLSSPVVVVFFFFFDFMWFFVLFWWPSSLSFFFFLYLPVPCSAGSLSLLGPLVWFDPESIRALCGAVKNFSAVLLRRRSNPVKPVESHFQTWNTTMSNPVEAVVGVARSKTDCFLVWKGNFWQKKHWKERNDWRLRQFQLNFVYGCHFLHVFNRKKLRNRFLKKRHPTYP